MVSAFFETVEDFRSNYFNKFGSDQSFESLDDTIAANLSGNEFNYGGVNYAYVGQGKVGRKITLSIK